MASRPKCESIFDTSNAFSQMFYQFNLQLREQIKIRQIQDPFSEACLTYARQTCILLVNELMQAHLIVSENTDSDDSPALKDSTIASEREQKNQFKEHCLHLANWGQAEQFYIFTVCNLV